MKIIWDISTEDIQKVKKQVRENKNAFVFNRQNKNIDRNGIKISKDVVIATMISCLLTSQQRSGPKSDVGKFLNIVPFPITYENIKSTNNISKYTKEILKSNNLNRYINRISLFFANNINKIEVNNWEIIDILKELANTDSKEKERQIADQLADEFQGFGPKQSRNFLQAIGLTRYEIPIDSRITNWLNRFGFPVPLSSSPLGDKGYYHFVLDGIQELCKQADIYPCMLDAAIFSSYDKGEWNKENIRF
jgi:thermostable 8-oxoguanine DNA glycosylase